MPEADASLAKAIQDDVGTIIDTDFVFDSGGQPNVFLGHLLMRGQTGIPEEAVFVEESGGAGPGRIFGDTNIDLRNVQVLYRGKKNDFTTAWKTARQIRKALEKVEIAGIIYVHALESAPLSAGLNGNERSIFSMNFEVAIKE